MREFYDRILRRRLPQQRRTHIPAGRISQGELIAHELAVAGRARTSGVDPYLAVIDDRKTRWEAWLHTMDIPPELQQWEARMSALYGPTVRVWHADLRWLVALLVVRYGEAEYYWPEEFQPADLERALLWESGDIPAATGGGRARVRASGEIG